MLIWSASYIHTDLGETVISAIFTMQYDGVRYDRNCSSDAPPLSPQHPIPLAATAVYTHEPQWDSQETMVNSHNINNLLFEALRNRKEYELFQQRSVVSENRSMSELMMRKQKVADETKSIANSASQYVNNVHYTAVNSGNNAQITLSDHIHPLDPDECDVYLSLVGASPTSTIKACSNHHINSIGEVEGFMYTCSGTDASKCLPLNRRMFFLHSMVECSGVDIILPRLQQKDASLENGTKKYSSALLIHGNDEQNSTTAAASDQYSENMCRNELRIALGLNVKEGLRTRKNRKKHTDQAVSVAAAASDPDDDCSSHAQGRGSHGSSSSGSGHGDTFDDDTDSLLCASVSVCGDMYQNNISKSSSRKQASRHHLGAASSCNSSDLGSHTSLDTAVTHRSQFASTSESQSGCTMANINCSDGGAINDLLSRRSEIIDTLTRIVQKIHRESLGNECSFDHMADYSDVVTNDSYSTDNPLRASSQNVGQYRCRQSADSRCVLLFYTACCYIITQACLFMLSPQVPTHVNLL